MISSIKFLFFLSLSSISLALEPTYRISESGKEKVYRVSQSELQCSPKNGGEEFTHTLENATKSDRIVSKAKSVAEDTESNVEIILYPASGKKTMHTRRVVSNEAYVKITNKTSIPDLMKSTGAKSYRTLRYTKEYIILTFENSWTCLEKTAALKGSKNVESANPLLKKIRAKKSTPNDPLYLFSNTNSGYLWHLNNTGENNGTAGIDINVSNVWDSYTGIGVTVGIIDDGLQTDHPDLIANVNTTIDFNWNNGDPDDPSPNSGDTHGTPCAGVTAAKGNNNIGGSGAAPDATLVGLRLIAGGVNDSDEAEAMSHESGLIQVKSNSWGPSDGQGTLDDAGSLTKAAFIHTITNGRGGLGTIHLWAAGNGGDSDDVNYDGFANSIYTIAIGAIDDQGNRSDYSEPGAAKLVSAPSDGGSQGITTTQINSTYTYSFGGTSSATPLAAGVAALMLDANPNLGWRDVQEILIRSARQINPADGSWVLNSANIPFSHEYGAGLIDAELAVKLSESWTNLATQQTFTVAASGLPLAVPDNDPLGRSVSFNVPNSNNFRVEHVTLTADISHPKTGELTVALTSPSGTKSILGTSGTLSEINISNWKYMSVFNWGEASEGTWTLTVTDSENTNTGTLNSASLTIYGAPLQTAAAAPTFISSSATSEFSGTQFHFKAFATPKVTSYTSTALPAGLTIDATTGAITGTATTPGVYSVTLTATNNQGITDSPLEITILNPDDREPRLSSPSEITIEQGTPMSYQITADFSPTSYSATNLPAGLTLNTSTGLISGTPTVIGSTQVAITAINDFGSDSITLTINVIDSFAGSYADALEVDQLSIDISTINTTDPSTIWSYQTTEFQVDNDALESPAIGGDGSTSFSVIFSEPAMVSFLAKLSTEEDYDVLTVTNSNEDILLTLSGEEDWAKYTVIISEATTLTWTYSKDSNIDTGSDTVWVDSITISTDLPEPIIAKALDFKGLAWPNDISFILDGVNTFDGVDALRFPNISNDADHTLEVEVEGPGTVTFYYKVSSEEDYDYFDFNTITGANTVNKLNVSGETAWIQYTETLPAGTHTLQWIYSKDGSASDGFDTVFLDEFSWFRSDFTPYQNWKLAQFTPDENATSMISGDSSDPDRDGIPNLLEYATGNSPDSAMNAHLITYTAGPNEMNVEYAYDTTATDVTLMGQYSLNLSDWLQRPHTVMPSDGNMEMRKISYPFNTDKAFLRLKATEITPP
jgi:subtilisin-like proprotein convertase family protein